MADQVPSPFESFNARALEPSQVARTFIPPSQFDQLVLRAHNLVIGPRGSGKTTLLKMLQEPALDAWGHDSADDYRRRVDFTGVFIPSDIMWRSQLDALVGQGFESSHAELFVNAAFTTNVFKGFVEALIGRTRRFVDNGFAERTSLELTAESEGDLARELAHTLGLTIRVASLPGLRSALGSRLVWIQTIASTEHIRGPEGRAARLAEQEALHFDFVSGVSACIDCVEMIAPGTAGHRWALLFDELELAPRAVQEKLAQLLRSVDQRLLFKLSVSPYNEDLGLFKDPLSASPGHDYEEVVLTYGRKEDSYDFCSQLFMSVLTDRFTDSIDPVDVLGRSEFETEPGEWRESGTAYRSDSRLGRRLQRLADADVTFRSYLKSSKIDLTRLAETESIQRASEVRKITSLAAVRLAFRTTDKEFAATGKRVRASQAAQLYAGASSIFAMVEGNPRWLIAISLRILAEQDAPTKARPAVQMREVRRAGSRFRALLRTIPVPDGPVATQRGLLSVLDGIGRYTFQDVVAGDFNPDPVGSFTVDSHAPRWLVESVGRALNAGAAIYVPDPGSEMVLVSLRGKRFRLSYLFAPHYRIPIRLGRAISLSKMLRGSGIIQEELFGSNSSPTDTEGIDGDTED